jgi:DNA-directed RNA polymerase specialized sigma24 family protein
MDADDTRVLQRIGTGPSAAGEVARELFFAWFEQIEAVIRHRLRWHGLPYDEGADHYNTLLELVYQRIFTPQALCAATAAFDPSRGRLEAWLLQRVAFVVGDWLKSRPAAPTVTAVPEVVEVAAETTAEADDAPATSASRLLEEALDAMTQLQRACAVLRLLPVRPPTDDDLAALTEISGRSLTELHEELKHAATPWREQEYNQRAQELLSALAAWHLRRAAEERKLRFFQSQLRNLGLGEDAIQDLVDRASRSTQREVRQWYTSSERDAMSRQEAAWRRKLALAAYRLQRCRQRIESLLKQLASLRAVPLLEHAEIARILGSTPQQVNACLHRARNCVGMVLARHAEG